VVQGVSLCMPALGWVILRAEPKVRNPLPSSGESATSRGWAIYELMRMQAQAPAGFVSPAGISHGVCLSRAHDR